MCWRRAITSLAPLARGGRAAPASGGPHMWPVEYGAARDGAAVRYHQHTLSFHKIQL